MSIAVAVSPHLSNLHADALEMHEIVVAESAAELRDYCDQVAKIAIDRFETAAWTEQCQEIRQMLRHGKFKPTGRSKPAQEYLMRCVTETGSLPHINAPVDLLNAVSLQFNLPISLLSVAKCSTQLTIDRGSPGEKYIFNSAGQELDLTDLMTVYDVSVDPRRPVGTPVKDSMAGKIEATDRHLIAIIYAPNSDSAMARCHEALAQLDDGIKRFCMRREIPI